MNHLAVLLKGSPSFSGFGASKPPCSTYPTGLTCLTRLSLTLSQLPMQLRTCLQCRRPGFDPWVRKIPWRRKWQPTPVFLPGESHGQRSLAGYSPWGRKESDTTEPLSTRVLFSSVNICLSSSYLALIITSAKILLFSM